MQLFTISPWKCYDLVVTRCDPRHVEDQGMGIQHVYIKPWTPQLNGKVERLHRTDAAEFYQLLTYTDDVDLSAKLEAWENFYNYDRPHMSHLGKTLYEVMRSLLK